MHAIRKLALHRREQIDELMRFLAAIGIRKRPVYEFLKHEVPLRIRGQIGEFPDGLKVRYVAVKIADDENIAGIDQMNEVSDATRRGGHRVDSPAKRVQHSVRWRHNGS